jgi:hypothetical protein
VRIFHSTGTREYIIGLPFLFLAAAAPQAGGHLKAAESQQLKGTQDQTESI